MQYPGAIDRFDGGIVDDIREPQTTRFGMSKHFDIFSNPFRLTPYRSSVAETTSVSAADLGLYKPRNFQLGTNGKMYAYGDNKSGLAQILEKADPTTGNWALSTTAVFAGVVVYGSFIEWQGAWWLFTGTKSVSKWVIATNTITDDVLVGGLGKNITTVAQAVIGPDDNLYMFYNNRVVRISNAGVVTDNVLTNLPSNMRITSACVWGSYIAIGMAYGTSATSAPVGHSKMYIWDMVTTTTVNDAVDMGEGALKVLGNIEGRVVGVSDKYLSTPASPASSLAAGYGSMVVRMWSGGTPKVMKEVVANQTVPADTATTTRFPRDVVVKDNKMYWAASVPIGPDSTSTESTYHLGIWAFGRKNTAAPFALTLDTIEEGVDTSNFYINSIGAAGNYWFISYSAAGLVNRTDTTANYTFTSIFESSIFNFIFGLRHRHIPDSAFVKDLSGVTVTFDPLPSGATVVLKMRQDEQTAWTQIFTYSGTGTIQHSAINIENITLGGDTATMTIASPAVVSLTAHKLVAGNTVRFTTTGALPTGVQAGLDYYVISTGLTANTFQFSATARTVAGVDGAAVNTSGSQSGTHTLDRIVNLANYREIQFRVESTGGAIITGLKFIFEQESRGIFD